MPLHLPVSEYDLDDDLLARVREGGPSAMHVRRPERPLVVLGRGSKLEREVKLARCEAEGVEIVRRRGGGCAVVIDPGNIVISLVLPVRGIGDNRRHLDTLSAWLIEGLREAGVDGVTQAGICDLVRGGKKISGACIHRGRSLLYYSATLLVAPRVDLIERYLKHPPREPDYRRGRRHGEFVGSLGLAVEPLLFALRKTLRPPDPGRFCPSALRKPTTPKQPAAEPRRDADVCAS